MAKKRPRSIAICVFHHKGRILVSEGYDSVKQEHFYRPIGGGIEYGENSKDALVREIREEIQAEITQLRLLGVIENIFVYEGKQGHEIVFVYDALFVDPAFYTKENIEASEDEELFRVVWKPIAFFRDNNFPLYPPELLELLEHEQALEHY